MMTVGGADLSSGALLALAPGGARPNRGEARDSARTGAEQAEASQLDETERRQVAELERTDQEVRAHEAAHLAAAGGLARGVSFSYVTGPDGRQYAVAGEVSIDTSPVSGDPEKTIQKAQQIRAAATAPAQPSGQDQQVAAQAAQMEQAARQELSERQRDERARAFEGSAEGAAEPGRGSGLRVYA